MLPLVEVDMFDILDAARSVGLGNGWDVWLGVLNMWLGILRKRLNSLRLGFYFR